MELITRQRRNAGEYGKLRAYGWLWAACAAALAVGFLFVAVFTAVRASDAGMAPFIEPGDIILFNKLAKHIKAPARGDVIAFTDGGEVYIARIVALPGESVQLKGGRVYIDGVLLDESAYASGEAEELDEFTVGEGCYLVLPDERGSVDLTQPDKLVIPGKSIEGRAFWRVYPAARIALYK